MIQIFQQTPPIQRQQSPLSKLLCAFSIALVGSERIISSETLSINPRTKNSIPDVEYLGHRVSNRLPDHTLTAVTIKLAFPPSSCSPKYLSPPLQPHVYCGRQHAWSSDYWIQRVLCRVWGAHDAGLHVFSKISIGSNCIQVVGMFCLGLTHKDTRVLKL